MTGLEPAKPLDPQPSALPTELHPVSLLYFITHLTRIPSNTVKLISLNTWGGKIYKPLINFVKENSSSTDIFCFQEIFNTTSNVKIRHERRMNLHDELSKILTNHQGYFSASLQNYIIFSRTENFKTDFNLGFGLSIFVKKDLKVDSNGDFFVYGDQDTFKPNDLNTLPRNVQYLTFTKGKKFTILNIHGIWLKGGKNDSPSRLEQSMKINEFLNKQKGEKILCGDFNLNMDTKSVKILEKDLINLIKEYNIQTTRNKLFPGNEKFADYTFVSKGIKVSNFAVPNIEISDHLPMILEFS